MLSLKQRQICTGLNSLSPYYNKSKSSCNLCYGVFSFIDCSLEDSKPLTVTLKEFALVMGPVLPNVFTLSLLLTFCPRSRVPILDIE